MFSECHVYFTTDVIYLYPSNIADTACVLLQSVQVLIPGFKSVQIFITDLMTVSKLMKNFILKKKKKNSRCIITITKMNNLTCHMCLLLNRSKDVIQDQGCLKWRSVFMYMDEKKNKCSWTWGGGGLLSKSSQKKNSCYLSLLSYCGTLVD